MQIYNSLDLRKGKKVDIRRMGTLTQPTQFLCENDKDEDWAAHNLDWHEFQGMKQLKRNARRLLKNYKLAKGIIDKSDYIIEDDNQYGELIDILTKEDESALELKFYPIIPNVINILCSEFSKRVSKIMFRAVDDISYNEMLEEKRGMLESTLLAQAQQKMQIQMMNMGMDLQGEEAQQKLSPDNLKSLPEIEQFFTKKLSRLSQGTHTTYVYLFTFP